MLNKGDKCYVRIHTGEIVEAEYDEKCFIKKNNHFVRISGLLYIACNKKPRASTIYNTTTVRFVNTNDLKEYNND